MMLGDHYNLYYYYQHFHKKKIIIGYFTKLTVKSKLKNFIYSDTPPDFVLSKISDKNKLKFRNMIDILDGKALKRSGARYVILHKNLVSEMFPKLSPKENVYLPIKYIRKVYTEVFGSPYFEDDKLIVFKIPD